MKGRARTMVVACICVAWGALGVPGEGRAQEPERDLERRIEDLARASGADVGVFWRTLDGRDSLVLAPDLRMHAASTMKVPVMIQLFRDRDAGRLSLDDPVEVTTTFHSIVDGTPYELPVDSDSESTLYRRVGGTATVRELIGLMITRSSNLATNLLIDLADPERVTATMRELGADSIEVLRGVEDIPAFRAGLSNTTTARDLGIVFGALGRGEAASPGSTREMIAILEDQHFRSRIPAGLPEGTRVANKTGWITGIGHDAALVFPDESAAYVLVVLIRGLEEDAEGAEVLAAAISRAVWEHHVGPGSEGS